jgi:O-antigen/teichoic acid export membrane protein
MVWVLVGFSVGIGLGLGYGSYNWPKFGLGIMGVVTGAILGVLVYTLCFSRQADILREQKLGMSPKELTPE